LFVPLSAAVEEVLPGLWSIPVPIPNNPLGYTLIYLFETPRGPVLIDAGWHDSWDALVDGVQVSGHEIQDCYGVLVTHHHNDHHGLSGRIREASGAWVAMHEKDADMVKWRLLGAENWYRDTVALFEDVGASREEIDELTVPSNVTRHEPDVPDHFIENGQRVDVPGWRIQAVWTPGHSPGHLCFVDVDHDLLFAGDHLLPKLSPHVGLARIDEPGDPLGRYLSGLRAVEGHGKNGILPAHEYRFEGAKRRVDELLEHHRLRLRSVELILENSPLTAWDIAKALTWKRTWDTFNSMTKRSAMTETVAHIRYLENRGRITRVEDASPVRFCLTTPPRTHELD
jgi:glyoxylase-like metal-dependent hydrolase (beta-lactamase superfamily II)